MSWIYDIELTKQEQKQKQKQKQKQTKSSCQFSPINPW